MVFEIIKRNAQTVAGGCQFVSVRARRKTKDLTQHSVSHFQPIIISFILSFIISSARISPLVFPEASSLHVVILAS